MDRPLSSSTLLFLVLSASVASGGAVTLFPEDYWREVLPNTPIPGAIRTLLYPDSLREVREAPFKNGARPTKWNYRSAANEGQARNDPVGAFFFLEKDLHPNTRKQLQFIRSAPPAPFIPRPVAGAIPFSSKKLPELMARFSLPPNSVEAEDMTVSLHGCEHSAVAGETKSCVTSLESMVDFATSNLGTRDVRASSTEVGREELEQKRQYYTVAAGVESLQEGGKAVICHVQAFPYAVFSCHATDSLTKAYKFPLVGEDGSKVTAVAVCHIDTSTWNPRNLAFHVLKVKPGSIPVCHFLRQDAVVWTPSM